MNDRRTLVITGANTGIGAAAAAQLARPGVRLILACRSEEKTRPVLDRLREAGAEARFVALDLTDLAGARRAGEALARELDGLDVLINNAGLAGQRGLTRDGYELAFGVNHLGHFAFTRALLPRLRARRGRVVNVSSGSHRRAREIPWGRLREATRSVSGLDEYGVSKLCNLLFTAELRRREPELSAVALNPGRIASDIWRRVPPGARTLLPWLLRMKPVSFGGATLVHAAEVELGDDAPLYFNKQRAEAPSPLALREDLARALWDYSLDACAEGGGDAEAA
ncbi:MAG: SDR family NAD(P)-dependent oxidoreductase [Polyangiales bacterium]